jgi:hypothetical protein
MAVRPIPAIATVIAAILLVLLVLAVNSGHILVSEEALTEPPSASPDAVSALPTLNAAADSENIAEDNAPIASDSAQPGIPEAGASTAQPEATSGGGSGLRALAEGLQHAVAREVAAHLPEHLTGTPGPEESSIEMSISGWVVDTDGQPLKEVPILVSSGNSRLQTKSSADGSFALAGTLAPHELSSLPPAVTLLASGEAQGYRSEQKRHVPVTAKNVEFVLAALGLVEGIAVDAATGKPLTSFEARIGLIWEGEQYVALPAHIGWENFNGPDGAFRFTNYGPEKIALQARAPGYILSETDFFNVPPGEGVTGIVIRVERGEDIAGVVLDEKTRKPIEMASVSCIQGQIYGAQPAVSSQVVVTGADGRFVLPGDEGGAVTNLMATHAQYSPGFAPNVPADERQNVAIYLKKGGALFGTVTSAGQPVREIAIIPKMTLTYPETTYAQGTGTDGDGAFRIENLPEGMYVVRILGRDGTTYGKVLAQVASGMETRLDADLQDFAQLGGWVLGVDGYDDLEFFMSDAQLPEEIMYNAGVREDGHFEYGRVLPGEYLIEVIKKDPPKKRYTEVVSLGPGERPEITLDFSTIAPEDGSAENQPGE